MLAAALALPAGAGASTLDLPASAGAPTFEIGFADALFSGDQGAQWAARTVRAGADSIRVNLYWSAVARGLPEDPRDPADPAYDFSAIDSAVRAADGSGLEVLMTVLSAPSYAEGPQRPSLEQASSGTWRPDPDALGDFAHAVAERYSGAFADPLGSEKLPEVDLYSAWNEPNISNYLTPQYVDGRNVSAGIYVGLLNAFYGEVKAVNPDAIVATGGTAPIGDPIGLRRTAPLEFWRDVMCLTPSLLRAESCASAERPRFDVLAHHPINYLSSPLIHADRPDDVLIADFSRLTDTLRAAERLGTVEPAGAHPLIAPELWWETKPGERRGISLRLQARYTALGLYMLWKQGAAGAWFLQVQDAPRPQRERPLGSYQTGIYTDRGVMKPTRRVISFPFVTRRLDRRRVLLWGRAPAGGLLRIDVKRGHRQWRRRAALRVDAGAIFTRELRLRGKARVQARVTGRESRAWRQAR